MSTLPAGARLRDIADRYDAFFVDQYGVLHDGTAAYPGAADALAEMSRLGKRTIVLTNSGRTAAHNEERLARMGIARSTYLACVSSGDVAVRLCETGSFPLPTDRQLRCLTISSPGDTNLSDRLGCIRTVDGSDADLVVIAGSQADRIAMEVYSELLRPAAERGVPCLCTNPDRQMLTPHGLAPAAGAIADLYCALGGTVTFVGKPHAEIYAAAHRLIAEVPKPRILCVGDSLDHDVAGGQGFGVATALVRTGILAQASDAELQGMIEAEGLTVDQVLAGFIW